jgi:glycosyltransferase involved in cell wall biosynthesis
MSKAWVKVHDCSNSVAKPHHRGGGGPVENDCIRYIKNYGCYLDWVDSPKDANVIITNDVFTDECLALDTPKVKRMDGVFWQHRFKERNEPLNRAAQQADHVVFISEFSKRSYFELYGEPLKSHSVVLNAVCNGTFYHRFRHGDQQNFKAFTFVAIASDWSREEKCLDQIIKFSKLLNQNSLILLIGKCRDLNIPSIKSLGYFSNHAETAKVLNRCHAFLNLSYKDAAPKVVAQGLNCGLPVFYRSSGGVPELVEKYGVGIPQKETIDFGETSADIPVDDMRKAYEQFMLDYLDIKSMLLLRGSGRKFSDMLGGYIRPILKLGRYPNWNAF